MQNSSLAGSTPSSNWSPASAPEGQMQWQTPRLARDRGQPLMRRVCVWSWRVGFCLLFLLPKKKKSQYGKHQVYYMKFPLLQNLASHAASGTPQWYPYHVHRYRGVKSWQHEVLSPMWSPSLTPICWEPALCSALRGTWSSWCHLDIGVLIDEPPRKSQKLQDLLSWPPDSSKWHYSWKPEELLGRVLRQLTFSVLKQAYAEGTIISMPRWHAKLKKWVAKWK